MKKQQLPPENLSWWQLRALRERLTFCHEVRDTETALQDTLPQDGERGAIERQGTTHQHVQNHPHTLQEHTHSVSSMVKSTITMCKCPKKEYSVITYFPSCHFKPV